MADVVRLDVERDRRRAAPAAGARPLAHPALMWVAAGQQYAHRRVRGAGASCGAAGPLTLAEPGSPPCPACYPRAGAVR